MHLVKCLPHKIILNSQPRPQQTPRKHRGKLTEPRLLGELAIIKFVVQELVEVVGEFVVEACVECPIVFVRIGRLVGSAGAEQYQVGRLHLLIQAHALARINNHEYFFVHFLDIHFVEHLGEVSRLNQFGVLNLKKVLSAVTVEINEYFCLGSRLQLLRLRKILIIPPPHHIQNRLITQILRLVIDLDVLTVQILNVVSFDEEGAGLVVSWITNMTLRQKEQNLIVSDTTLLEVIIKYHDVARVPVVEVEF